MDFTLIENWFFFFLKQYKFNNILGVGEITD